MPPSAAKVLAFRYRLHQWCRTLDLLSFGGYRRVALTAHQGNCIVVRALKFHRQAQAFPAVFALEHGEMQVRAIGESGVAGQPDQVSCPNAVAHLHFIPPPLEMRIDADGAIRMLD